MNKRPSVKLLERKGKIWWTDINGAWVKCIPYNIKEEEVVKSAPQGGDDLNDLQFRTIMNKFDEMVTKEDLKIVEAKVDDLSGRVNNLTTIVKKNHPKDFK